MPAPKPGPDKASALRRHHALNPRPGQVADPAFNGANTFFDPEDLVQVKYEMLRRVREDGLAIAQASAAFGFSRPSFYEAQVAFERAGLPGLVPKRPAKTCPQAERRRGRSAGRGPGRRAGPEQRCPGHPGPAAPRPACAPPQCRAGIAEAGKRRPARELMTITAGAPELAQGYEALRAEALGLAPAARPRGRAVLIGAGLPAWMTALAPLAPGSRVVRPPCHGRDDRRDGRDGELVHLLAAMVAARCGA